MKTSTLKAAFIPALVLGAAPALSGCVAAQIAGAAVSTTGAVVGSTARAGGAVVDAALPDGDKDDD